MHAHHLRRELDVSKVLAVAKATPEWRAIPHCALAPRLAEYYQSDDELWARAFARWTVHRTGDQEGLRELKQLAADKWFYVWRDFDGISAAMDEAFIKKGCHTRKITEDRKITEEEAMRKLGKLGFNAHWAWHMLRRQ